MRFLLAAAAFAALAACSQPAPTAEAPAEQQIAVNAPSGEYQLDPNHSNITVRARRFGISTYTLRFNTLAGSLNFNAEDPTQSSVQATVAVGSLDTPYQGERDFDAELQNSSWLDAAGFPDATFRSTSVERTGPNTARVTGDLSFRGATHPITFDVTYYGSHSPHPMGMAISSIGFSARGALRRSQYGLNELQPSSAGANDGVSDEVEIVIEALFSRPIEGAAQGPATAEPVN